MKTIMPTFLGMFAMLSLAVCVIVYQFKGEEVPISTILTFGVVLLYSILLEMQND